MAWLGTHDTEGPRGRGPVTSKGSLSGFSLLKPAAANLKASHFSEKALCVRGGIVWGLINTKLLQKNLFKHLITCKEMLTCLTPLN